MPVYERSVVKAKGYTNYRVSLVCLWVALAALFTWISLARQLDYSPWEVLGYALAMAVGLFAVIALLLACIWLYLDVRCRMRYGVSGGVDDCLEALQSTRWPV